MLWTTGYFMIKKKKEKKKFLPILFSPAMLKFIYSEEATKFFVIFTLLLYECTANYSDTYMH